MKKILSTTLAAAALTAVLGSVTPAHAYYPPPPALRIEVRPPIPHPGWIWRPGYWNWAGGRYVWIGGAWAAPGYYPGWRAGWHWVPGHWGRFGHWIPAHWAP